ncbi:MAG: hypothetical protein HY791_26415 [Deltaproteobacteria bacterium]|nr:hypothetical protein [Deltaproteobacteria bacterium]
MRAAPIIVTLSVGCADSLASVALSDTHPPIRSLCLATDIPLFVIAKLSCSPFPPNLATGPFQSWNPRPSGVHIESSDGATVGDSVIGPELPESPNATYRDDGNIDSLILPQPLAATARVLRFEYEGKTLVGAYAEGPEGRQGETSIEYENGLRAREIAKGHDHLGWKYVYDGESRLIARIGLGSNLPSTPHPDMLEKVCHGWTVPPIAGNAGDAWTIVGATYYFRDDLGRISTVVHGTTPGLEFSEHTYAYEGDKLVSVTAECSSNAEPFLLGTHRMAFRYE